MKTNISHAFTFAVALLALSSAHAGWNRLPYAEKHPVNLATKAIPGTKLLSSTELGNAQSLIASNINEPITLATGKSSAVIQLGSQQNVHTVIFTNDGAEGKIAIAGSADNKNWFNLGSALFSPAERIAQVYFAPVTVKYVKVAFDSATGGTIRSFKIFGNSTNRDYNLVPKVAVEGGIAINFASPVGGAVPIYAFPSLSNVGKPNYLHSVFEFPKTSDRCRTLVYDLGGIRSIEHVAASYSQRPVRIEIFAFKKLSEKRDWRGKLSFDPTIFNSIQPVAVGEDAKGEGHIMITPVKAIKANYIAIRFEPDYQNNIATGFLNIGTHDLIAATAGPAGATLAGLGMLPEFRFTRGQNVDGADFTVGDLDFASLGVFQQIASANGSGQGYQDGQGDGHLAELEAAAAAAAAAAALADTVEAQADAEYEAAMTEYQAALIQEAADNQNVEKRAKALEAANRAVAAAQNKVASASAKNLANRQASLATAQVTQYAAQTAYNTALAADLSNDAALAALAAAAASLNTAAQAAAAAAEQARIAALSAEEIYAEAWAAARNDKNDKDGDGQNDHDSDGSGWDDEDNDHSGWNDNDNNHDGDDDDGGEDDQDDDEGDDDDGDHEVVSPP